MKAEYVVRSHFGPGAQHAPGDIVEFEPHEAEPYLALGIIQTRWPQPPHAALAPPAPPAPPEKVPPMVRYHPLRATCAVLGARTCRDPRRVTIGKTISLTEWDLVVANIQAGEIVLLTDKEAQIATKAGAVTPYATDIRFTTKRRMAQLDAFSDGVSIYEVGWIVPMTDQDAEWALEADLIERIDGEGPKRPREKGGIRSK